MPSQQLRALTSDIDALAHRGYSVGAKIGEGTYATVMTAGFVDTDARSINLACKIIDKSRAAEDFVCKFFPRELEILQKIDHPNIIQVLIF